MRAQLMLFVQFVVNIVISTIIVAITQQILKIDTYQDIIFGALLFICISALQTNHAISRNYEVSQRIDSQHGMLNEIHGNVKSLVGVQASVRAFTVKIHDISEGLKQIISKRFDKNDLVVHWYNDKLDSLLGHINHTLETESFYFDTSLLREQDRIFKVFQGRETDYHWATATCQGIAWFLTTSGDIFLRAIYMMLKDGKLRSVRRLFVYDTESELLEFNTVLCFYLHESSGFDYRIMSRADFEAIFRGFGDRTLVTDFGLYGAHFIWETPPEETTIIQYGQVCFNVAKITAYSQLFEHLWSQAITHRVTDQKIIERYKDFRMDSFRREALAADLKSI